MSEKRVKQPETRGSAGTHLLGGFEEWFSRRGYAVDCPSDRMIAEEAWQAARGLQFYPCADCGCWRTKSEGGTTFTVCDECWSKHYGSKSAS